MFPVKTPIYMIRRHLTTVSAEKGKQWAGRAAIEDLLQQKPNVIGLGSGSTIVYAIEHLAKVNIAQDIVCIPTSFQTRQLILDHKLKLGSLEQYPNVDITIDGADEIDPNLNAIKGGGACLFQERLVAQASKKFMLVADERKKSSRLGSKWKRGVPVEVVPMALGTIQLQLKHAFPSASIILRMATQTDKAGPIVTDNGNLILDCNFGPIQEEPALLYQKIKCLSGVLDVGLFCKMAEVAYLGSLEKEGGEIIRVD